MNQKTQGEKRVRDPEELPPELTRKFYDQLTDIGLINTLNKLNTQLDKQKNPKTQKKENYMRN